MPEDKEVKYRDKSGEVVSETVEAEDLDDKMEEADRVFGVEGDKKRRAAYLAQDNADTPDEPVTGEREN